MANAQRKHKNIRASEKRQAQKTMMTLEMMTLEETEAAKRRRRERVRAKNKVRRDTDAAIGQIRAQLQSARRRPGCRRLATVCANKSDNSRHEKKWIYKTIIPSCSQPRAKRQQKPIKFFHHNPSVITHFVDALGHRLDGKYRYYLIRKHDEQLFSGQFVSKSYAGSLCGLSSHTLGEYEARRFSIYEILTTLNKRTRDAYYVVPVRNKKAITQFIY